MKKNFLLKNYTTIRIGGRAKFFCIVKSKLELVTAIEWARIQKMMWCVVGEGSNLVVSDRGYPGLIIQNEIKKFNRDGKVVTIGAGNNLFETIFRLNRLGLAGMERMAGIPGTVGGAIYGCAGAYGQELKDALVKVRFFDGKNFRVFTNKQCQFGYRESIFKKRKEWTITEVELRLKPAKSSKLLAISREIINLRKKKYHPGLNCPGSFFKNVRLVDLGPVALKKLLKKIDRTEIKYGKLPTGYLLEQVGAKGMKQGSIKVAKHHANLIYNSNGGKGRDVVFLAAKLKALVKKKFGIIIEEEVQYLGFEKGTP